MVLHPCRVRGRLCEWMRNPIASRRCRKFKILTAESRPYASHCIGPPPLQCQRVDPVMATPRIGVLNSVKATGEYPAILTRWSGDDGARALRIVFPLPCATPLGAVPARDATASETR